LATALPEPSPGRAVCLPEGFDGNEVAKPARLRYNLSLGLGLSKVARSDTAMRDLGFAVEPGSGVATAEEYDRRTARPVQLNDAAAAAM
jgi:hypothetical protein